jgi:hypothetical protein
MPPTDQEADDFVKRQLARLPAPMRRAMQWIRRPNRRWLRLPVGVLLICGGLVWFLPLVGLWMLPLGLLLIAQDIPPLKRRLAGAMMWLEARWKRR